MTKDEIKEVLLSVTREQAEKHGIDLSTEHGQMFMAAVWNEIGEEHFENWEDNGIRLLCF